MTATLWPRSIPRSVRALARRLTRSCTWRYLRRTSPQTSASRSGTMDALMVRNSAVFIFPS